MLGSREQPAANRHAARIIANRLTIRKDALGTPVFPKLPETCENQQTRGNQPHRKRLRSRRSRYGIGVLEKCESGRIQRCPVECAAGGGEGQSQLTPLVRAPCDSAE